MKNPLVSLVKYSNADSVAEAIRLCNGFASLTASHKVLLKPNLCGNGAGLVPPYGMVTTTAVIEGVVRALKDFGVTDITIADGCAGHTPEVHTTEGIFRWIKLDKLAEKYGVKLRDLNLGPFRNVVIDNVRMKIAEAALATDFFIGLPVLKTHFQLHVTLAGKNLKGCMAPQSKNHFHRNPKDTLDHGISVLMEAIPQHLVLIDGIYALAKGPDGFVGEPHPKGILVGSTDLLAADAVGTRLVGGNPAEVGHLRLYAQKHNRMDVLDRSEAIEVRGEPLEAHCEYLPWQRAFCDTMKAAGHSGIDMKGDVTTCTGCITILFFVTTALAALSQNGDFGDAVVLSGRNSTSDRNSPKILLLGNCAIKHNKHLDQATEIKGCPPDMELCLKTVASQMQDDGKIMEFFTRLASFMEESKKGIGWFPVPTWKRYENNPAFDLRYFDIQ